MLETNSSNNIFAKPANDANITWWMSNRDWVLIVIFFVVVALAFLALYFINRNQSKKEKVLTVYYNGTQKKVNYGTLFFPEMPAEKDGYYFGGWFKDSACTEPWKSEDRVKHDMTLYPKWIKER